MELCALRCEGNAGGWPRPSPTLLNRSAIIRFLASKSLSFMLLGVPVLKRVLTSLAVLVTASVTIVACSGYKSSSNSNSTHRTSGLKFRAFVSNPLFPSGGFNAPVINIVDASKDVLAPSLVSLVANSPQPGLMALSSDLKFTGIFSPVGNSVTIIDNNTESVAGIAGTTATLPSITLPGLTESMFFSNDHNTLYAAVPSAPTNESSPGAVEVLNLQTGAISASLPVPGAHFIVPSPDGNSILVFSDNSDNVTVIATVLIGTHSDPRSTVTGFDRPVWGVFNGSSSAFVLNCGPQCGGKTAGVSILDIGSSTSMGTVTVSAATYGMLNGTTLYVAGTPPPNPPGTNTCTGTKTAATTCGRLTILDAGSLTVTGSAIITDGRHSRMQISQDGQLYIGAHGCKSINIPRGEVRGCLSVFNTSTAAVTIPPQVGDVTGLQPIAGRNIMYVVQNGSLSIFDTTTNQLQVSPTNSKNNKGQVDIVGQPFDVKLVD